MTLSRCEYYYFIRKVQIVTKVCFRISVKEVNVCKIVVELRWYHTVLIEIDKLNIEVQNAFYGKVYSVTIILRRLF